MLQELRIQNLAIIDKLEIGFTEGFNVLTGETGAGKSIIIDALELVLGGRASSELIRTGVDEAVVEAAFDIGDNKKLLDLIDSLGIGIAKGDNLIIKRIISRTGKNRIHINNSLTNLSTLTTIGDELIDIHGQHEHQSLLKTDKHIDMLDAFGNTVDGGGILKLRKEVGACYSNLKALEVRLSELENKERDRARQEEFLRYQIREIEEASLKPKEDEGLSAEKAVASNAERLSTLSNNAYGRLYEGDSPVLSELTKILASLNDINKIDSRMDEPLRLCQSAINQLNEVAKSMRDYAQRIEFDPERLTGIEDRLDLINRLKKKYGITIDEILLYLEKAKGELQTIEGLEEEMDGLKAEIEKVKKDVSHLSMELSKKREKAARDIEKKVEAELSELNMKKTRFVARMWKEAGNDTIDGFALTARGIDRVEFLIAPNVGEEPKPLTKIVSGGELSRIMLALKAILAEADDVPTLVFDEVDAGIGGGVAEVVGERLKTIAKGHQVFCITHLPQIAGYAESHYFVEKAIKADRTLTKAARLNESDRVKEIARMLGGKQVTETTLKHAEEMLGKCKTRHDGETSPTHRGKETGRKNSVTA